MNRGMKSKDVVGSSTQKGAAVSRARCILSPLLGALVHLCLWANAGVPSYSFLSLLGLRKAVSRTPLEISADTCRLAESSHSIPRR